MLTLDRPGPSEHAEYYSIYIDRARDGDVVANLRDQAEATLARLGSLDESRARHRYAPGKWSCKEVLGHVIDAERVFAWRALAIARGDPADQPSMDQDQWMTSANFEQRPLASLLAEYRAVRDASLALFGSFDAAVGVRTGRASGNPFTVRSLVWIVAGHELHHLGILRDRYGIA